MIENLQNKLLGLTSKESIGAPDASALCAGRRSSRKISLTGKAPYLFTDEAEV
jgi:hypothetical protein